MSVIDKIRAKAAANVKHVVLAEGTEPRTVQAAAEREGITERCRIKSKSATA